MPSLCQPTPEVLGWKDTISILSDLSLWFGGKEFRRFKSSISENQTYYPPSNSLSPIFLISSSSAQPMYFLSHYALSILSPRHLFAMSSPSSLFPLGLSSTFNISHLDCSNGLVTAFCKKSIFHTTIIYNAICPSQLRTLRTFHWLDFLSLCTLSVLLVFTPASNKNKCCRWNQMTYLHMLSSLLTSPPRPWQPTQFLINI